MLNHPNFSQDAPPLALVIGGTSYEIDYDFRTWIEVSSRMHEFWSEDGHEIENLSVLFEIETLVFGGRLEEDTEEVMRALTTFMHGYPEAPLNGVSESSDPVVDFSMDLNAIVIAIRNQSSIDLSFQRKEPFHWWLFLLEFHCLAGEHWITRLMQIRGYDGNDKEQNKLKYRYALPPRLTPEEKAQMNALNRALGD